MVDRDLSNKDAELAGRVEVMSGLDLRLVYIDPAADTDKFIVMQGLKDPSISEKDPKDPKTCYYYMRAGGTGTRGEIELEGPWEHTKVAKMIAEKFKEMTGFEWNTVEPGHRPLPGKYWLQVKAAVDDSVQWQYYVDDGIDGKRKGWYPYEATASGEVEEIYAQHIANNREDRTKSRLIQSGYFKYQVDLEKMEQQNTKSKTTRTIRRATGDMVLDPAMPIGVFSKAKKTATMKVEAKKKKMPAEKLKKKEVAVKLKKVGSKEKIPAMKKGKVAMKAVKPMKVKKAVLKKKKAKTKAEMKLVKVAGESKSDKKDRLQRTLVAVWRGKLKRTPGGLKKDDLMKNKRGKIVSKKKSAKGKEQFSRVATWVAALKQGRKELGLTGKDTPKKGSPLYKKAQELMATVKPHPTK